MFHEEVEELSLSGQTNQLLALSPGWAYLYFSLFLSHALERQVLRLCDQCRSHFWRFFIGAWYQPMVDVSIFRVPFPIGTLNLAASTWYDLHILLKQNMKFREEA